MQMRRSTADCREIVGVPRSLVASSLDVRQPSAAKSGRSAGASSPAAVSAPSSRTPQFALVYVKPGASLKPYTKFAILNCYVSFAPNWREDMQTNFDIPITEDQIKQTETRNRRRIQESLRRRNSSRAAFR